MLNVTLRTHRSCLRAGTGEPQKLFAMLKIAPRDVEARRPPVAFALVIDTSSSMLIYSDQAGAGAEVRRRGLQAGAGAGGDGRYQAVALRLDSKLGQAVKAARALVDDERLGPEDQIAICRFDHEAHTCLPLMLLSDRQAAQRALDEVRSDAGGTRMAQGMRRAMAELQQLPTQMAKRVVLLTDGQTEDEPECRHLGAEFAKSNAPVIAVGIGEEYNEDLMITLGQMTQGRSYHLQAMEELGGILNDEVGSVVREVVTDLQATLTPARGVSLDGLTRVYPSLAEAGIASSPYRLGNVAAGDYTVFVLDFTVEGTVRAPGSEEVATVSLSGEVPGSSEGEYVPPRALPVTFTEDEEAVSRIDMEVMGYVWQRNLYRDLRKALDLAPTDPGLAGQMLHETLAMARRVGNSAMERRIKGALEELDKNGTVSIERRRTITLGGITHTIKTGPGVPAEMPSYEEARDLTGA